MLALVLVVGCRSSMPKRSATVASVVRSSDDGAESLAEGDTRAAIRSFRRAVHRAWASDDPYHAGTNAYNLAAALFAHEDHAQHPSDALNWLIDARVELKRAGTSAGNTYLLESKIAQAEGRVDDAMRMIRLASCSAPPCEKTEHDAPSECGRSKLACVPWLGDKLEERKKFAQCADDYRAQVHLARSRMAAGSFELALASGHLAEAKHLAEDVCGDELRAEIHHATALIEMARGKFLSAAAHFDCEAKAWRLAGTYRKVPDALQLAAAAYQQVDRFDLASDRLCRSARCLFAQGKLQRSWEAVQQAFTFAELTPTQSANIRLMLTAQEIEMALTEQTGGKPNKSKPEPQEPSVAPELMPAGMLLSD